MSDGSFGSQVKSVAKASQVEPAHLSHSSASNSSPWDDVVEALLVGHEALTWVAAKA